MIKIFLNDCTKIIKTFPDASMDMILTDPPYGINYATNHRQKKTHDFCTPIMGDKDLGALKSVMPDLFRILKNNTACFVFSDSQKQDEVVMMGTSAGFKLKNRIIWDKMNHTAGDLKGAFGKRYEVILFFAKGRPLIRGKRYPDIWQYPKVPAHVEVHQNQKPVELLKKAICSMTDKGAFVCDPFMGSGSTGVACRESGRSFVGIELDSKYFNIAQTRLFLADGKEQG